MDFDAVAAARAALASVTVPPAPQGPAADQADLFDRPDGMVIRYLIWHPAPEMPPRGTVLLLQGRGEFVEKYAEVAGWLRAAGWVVFAPDWRGQGRSGRVAPDRAMGHLERFDDCLDDLDALAAGPLAGLPRPLAMLGHSMGGHLGMRWVLERVQGPARPAAIVLSAPMIDIRMPLPARRLVPPLARLMRARGRGMTYAPGQGPGRASGGGFAGNRLTHDPARWAREQALLAADPALHLGGSSWGWLAAAFDSIRDLERAVIRMGAGLDVPVTLLQGGADMVVDPVAQSRLVARLPRARLVVVPGALHEILMETDEIQAPARAVIAQALRDI